ncbi:hypothetical protein BD309DRAFT_951302 [Dichomitus squalens]|nr:hypothetical protein BD309DRAFT_951302 [Dichomitus squalens]
MYGIIFLSFLVIQLCVSGIGDNHPKFLLSDYGSKLLLPRIAEPGYHGEYRLGRESVPDLVFM